MIQGFCSFSKLEKKISLVLHSFKAWKNSNPHFMQKYKELIYFKVLPHADIF